jgi:hypothetical protein
MQTYRDIVAQQTRYAINVNLSYNNAPSPIFEAIRSSVFKEDFNRCLLTLSSIYRAPGRSKNAILEPAFIAQINETKYENNTNKES